MLTDTFEPAETVWQGQSESAVPTRITYYKEGLRCRERFRTEGAARTRAQEVRKELEKGTIHIGTFTAKDHHVLVEALKIPDKRDSGLLEAVRHVAEAKRLLDGKGTLMEAVRLFLSEAAREKNHLPREAKTEAEFTTSYDLGRP